MAIEVRKGEDHKRVHTQMQQLKAFFCLPQLQHSLFSLVFLISRSSEGLVTFTSSLPHETT